MPLTPLFLFEPSWDDLQRIPAGMLMLAVGSRITRPPAEHPRVTPSSPALTWGLASSGRRGQPARLAADACGSCRSCPRCPDVPNPACSSAGSGLPSSHHLPLLLHLWLLLLKLLVRGDKGSSRQPKGRFSLGFIRDKGLQLVSEEAGGLESPGRAEALRRGGPSLLEKGKAKMVFL